MHLTELDLGYNQISARGCEALAHALRSCAMLQELRLRNNVFGDEGCFVLAESLAAGGAAAALRVLDARDSCVTAAGWAALRTCAGLELPGFVVTQEAPRTQQDRLVALQDTFSRWPGVVASNDLSD
jgi:Ran GTPase-activating protein (RanGAP) involved in mRNA processing and transport